MSEDERRIEEWIRRVRFDDEPDPGHRDRLQQRLVEALERQRRRSPGAMAIRALRKGAHIMNRNYVKYPAAAAAVFAVAAMLLMHLTAPKAYAVSDVPQLLRGAKTVHLRAWQYQPTIASGDQDRVKVTAEVWFDLDKGRYRKVVPSVGNGGCPGCVKGELVVCDGRVVMTVDRAGKTVSYEKLTPFDARRRARAGIEQYLRNIGYAFGPGQGRLQREVGQEAIQGKQYDIYVGEKTRQGAGIRFRTWFAPATGDVGRLIVWVKRAGGDWLEFMGLDIVERDVPLPPGAFGIEPPTGYTRRNTPETAPASTLKPSGAQLGQLKLATFPSFIMPDGSVIVCWYSEDLAAGPPPGEVFTSLRPGGPLPQLPVVIRSLEAITTDELLDYLAGMVAATKPAAKPPQYVGRHLATTTKGGRVHEWSLYVPLSTPPPPDAISTYRCVHEFTPRNRRVNGSMRVGLPVLTSVGRDDFDLFVRGQMAELSDTGAPKDVTFDAVMKLAKTIRDELKKE